MAMISESRTTDGLDLTQNLWLFSILQRDPELQRNEPKDFNALLVLDAVALFLTNGHPDGHIATFYNPNTSALYLAKSGPADPGDDNLVTAFLAEINTATRFKDLLPFLARRSGPYVNKRVQQLRQYFDQSQRELMRDMAEEVQDQNFSKALEVCTGLLASDVPFSEAPEACKNFRDLVYACRTICKRIRGHYNSREREFQTLWYHFESMSQYAGAQRLIVWWKRHGSKIHVSWVPESPLNAPSCTLNPRKIADQHVEALFEHWKDPVRRALGKETMLEYMDQIYRGWRDPTSLSFTLRLHAEIRLILFLTTHGIDGIRPQSPISELIIGCSERICCCCSFWIKAFNAAHGMNWVTRFGNECVRYDWLCPDATGVYNMEVGFRTNVAEDVEDRLLWLLHRQAEDTLDTYEDIF